MIKVDSTVHCCFQVRKLHLKASMKRHLHFCGNPAKFICWWRSCDRIESHRPAAKWIFMWDCFYQWWFEISCMCLRVTLTDITTSLTHRFRCSMRISGGLSKYVRTVVSLLSPHPEHSNCSPPVRIVCSKNSDRQSCSTQRQNYEKALNNISNKHAYSLDYVFNGAKCLKYLNGALDACWNR